jgi:hypothetical protein
VKLKETMGKMKELFIQQQEEFEYQELAKEKLEKFIKVDATPCPNCFKPSLLRNESEASCEACGQGFYYVKGALRFK